MPGRGTRPTSDRVREALFSRLDHAGVLPEARVLDLYAGSGALGLEAASRGARAVVLVEAARDAARTCRANADALGLGARVEVAAARVESFLSGSPGTPFDVAFLDPPYELDDDALAPVLDALAARWLAPEAAVVVERSRRSPEPRWPGTLDGQPVRLYGDTALWFATFAR